MGKYYLSIITILLLATSCNKYLDVKPEDRFLDSQIYGNRTSIQNALNSVYLNMAKTNLYGENLSSTTIDVLAQLYPCLLTGDVHYSLARYNYTEANARAKLQQSWNSSYTAILNLNLFLHNVEPGTGILPDNEKDLMVGEAYALRAFLAFDMLRLFGPVYSVNPGALSVPYPVTPGTEISALLPASAVADSVLSDLQKAEQLLVADPVRTEGVKAADLDETFFRYRNRRMNYYAVRALLARVKLYRGDKAGALQDAVAVINEASRWFPWSPSGSSSPGVAKPDRTFSSEVIFSVENSHMYTSQSTWFYAGNASALLPLPSRLNTIYNNYPNDFRYRICWEVDNTTSNTEKAFVKYADVTDKTASFRFLQPLVRMSEMYYIAAECEPDLSKAETYFNTVLVNRGLPNTVLTADRLPQLRGEYEKEFWGEGQLFFLYKRLNLASIPSGSSATGTVSMDAAKYVPPLPLSETEYR